MILGGGSISNYNFSKAWGINPSAASGTVVIDNTGGGSGSFSLAVGQYVAYSFASVATFYGIITETGASAADPSSGLIQTFSVADNRIRLGWQMLFACFNMEDEMAMKRFGRPAPPGAPGDGSSGGGDTGVDFSGVTTGGVVVGTGDPDDPGNAGALRRRYWHILPQHQESGIRTWTDNPYTARQILNIAFEGAWGDFGFSRNYHSALDDVILTNLDHLGGVKMSNFIAEINEKAGLDLSISGANQLIWDRKGEGLPPLADDSSDQLSQGEAITTNDTALRVIGERTRVQVMNVELVKDWRPGFEPFIDELAWRREIASTYAGTLGIDTTDSKSNQANIAALALTVTVFDYAKKKDDASLLDYRGFGQGSRAKMPAWLYIQEFVYRAYAIPPTHLLYGIPISSLEMADTLLCATDISGVGAAAKQVYKTGPIEFYPASQAEFIHKGQPLDLIDSREIRLFYRNTTGDLRNEWTVAADYEVDTGNMGIRFSKPVFIDGLPSEGKSIYLKPNKGEGGGSDLTSLVAAGSDYLDIVVPNPAYEITAASIKASFCFLLGRFQQDYGFGPRRGCLNVSGLGLHVLDATGDEAFSSTATTTLDPDSLRVPDAGGRTLLELKYENGGTAIARADAASSSQLALSAIQATGGFTRHGVCGTSLNGAVDRITLSITQTGGITEQVSYCKARASGVAFSEKTLTRIQRTAEIYPGMEQLKADARQYRNIAFAEKNNKKIPRTSTLKTLADVFAKPVGGESPQTTTLYDTASTAAPTRGEVTGWQAGDIVWKNEKGQPSKTGKAFGGILVATPVNVGGDGTAQTKGLAVAIRGVVPVRIRGTVVAGGAVLADPGAHYGGSTGSKSIGTLMHGEDVPVPSGQNPEVLAMVNLGGSAETTKDVPLSIVDHRPPYIPQTTTPVATGFVRFYLTWGFTQGVRADNWNNLLDVPTASATSRYLFMKAYLTPVGDTVKVLHCEWVTGTAADSYATPEWSSNGERPEYMIIPLGSIEVDGDGVTTIHNAGGGSITLGQHIYDISFTGTSSATIFHKMLSYVRPA